MASRHSTGVQHLPSAQCGPLHALRGGARYERDVNIAHRRTCQDGRQVHSGFAKDRRPVRRRDDGRDKRAFWYMLADSLIKAAVFFFITQRILQAWRPQEFDQACLDKGVGQNAYELALTVLLICAVSLAGYWVNTKLLPWAAFAFYGFALLRALARTEIRSLEESCACLVTWGSGLRYNGERRREHLECDAVGAQCGRHLSLAVGCRGQCSQYTSNCSPSRSMSKAATTSATAL